MDRPCPICSCTERKKLYTQDFNNKVISLMEKYDVVVCNECGFVYADNIPSQEEFNNYYEVMSKYEFEFKEGIVASDYFDHFSKIADFISPHITDKNARILDIGCSTGALLSRLQVRGYSNLTGIDPSPACASTVKRLYGIEASANTISNFKCDEKFDVIILSAVLEHLVDFDDSLKKIRHLLKDGGLFFVEIPDAERFHSYIYTAFQQFSIEHINYFSEPSVRNLLSKFSFEILDIEKTENRILQTIDPDIFIVSRKSDEGTYKIIRDDISEIKIGEYISECSKIDIEVKQIIKEKLLYKDKIIVWGIGTHTQRLIGAGLDLSKILYFVDSNTRYSGKKINGIEIKQPSDIVENIPILISTYSYQNEILAQIKEKLKLQNEIITIYGNN